MSQLTTNDCALILMCKRPQPGIGKQRVAQTHGTAIAFVLAQRLLACALEDLANWRGPKVIGIANANDASWAARQLPEATVIPQGSGNLGDRIGTVSEAVGKTTPRQLYIGIDAPTLNDGDYTAAASSLKHHDIVLADADDGGVVLMGCRDGWPDIRSLPWSTETLGASLAETCVAAGLSVAKTASHADVDFADQFDALIAALATDTRASRQALLAWLKQIKTRSAPNNVHA